MQTLNRKEKIVALGGLALISASITFIDWWQRGQLGTLEAILAGLTAIIVMFWIPMSLGYVLTNKFGNQHIIRELPIWYICFYIGFFFWAQILEQIYPTFVFGWSDLIVMALPWAVGTFIIYKAYITYKTLHAERLLRQAMELHQLKQALHPHFLFNSLNTLSAFISANPQKAEQLTHDLADVLRQVLATDQVESISLKHELMVLQKWLNVEQARLGDDLKVNFMIDERAISQRLPPFLLQPILENCIKHRHRTPIEIDVRCEVLTDGVLLEVRDKGLGFPSTVLDLQSNLDKLTGVGLKTTLQRITMLEGARYQLKNGPAPYGAVVHILLESTYD